MSLFFGGDRCSIVVHCVQKSLVSAAAVLPRASAPGAAVHSCVPTYSPVSVSDVFVFSRVLSSSTT